MEGKTESYKNKNGLSQTRCVALDIKYLESKNNNSYNDESADPFSEEM